MVIILIHFISLLVFISFVSYPLHTYSLSLTSLLDCPIHTLLDNFSKVDFCFTCKFC